jgi:hypothetical protein
LGRHCCARYFVVRRVPSDDRHVMHSKPSNQALERTATRFGSTSPVTKTSALQVTPVVGGRRSAYSR